MVGERRFHRSNGWRGRACTPLNMKGKHWASEDLGGNLIGVKTEEGGFSFKNVSMDGNGLNRALKRDRPLLALLHIRSQPYREGETA